VIINLEQSTPNEMNGKIFTLILKNKKNKVH